MPVSEAPMPLQRLLPLERAFTNDFELPNVELISEYFYNQGKVTKEVALKILKGASTLFSKDPNVLRVDGKVTIVGDVHGQYYDLH